MIPKLIITDIDGVWTDGGMYIANSGDEYKKFNTTDSFGVLLAKSFNIKTCIITGEKTEIVNIRAKKLAIDYVFQGVTDKLKVAKKLIEELEINFNEVAYIGDDIGDYNLLKKVGFAACPDQSPKFIKDIVSFVTKSQGGNGSFREFVIKIFLENNYTEEQIINKINEYN